MKYALLFLLATVASYASLAQKPVYYVDIPYSVQKGSISYDLHIDRKDSSFSIIFSEMPNRISDAAILFIVDRKSERMDSSYLIGKKVITPQAVQDSLTATGWDFFRSNLFYCIFKRGAFVYIHKAVPTYIYANFEGDDQSVTDSLYKKE